MTFLLRIITSFIHTYYYHFRYYTVIALLLLCNQSQDVILHFLLLHFILHIITRSLLPIITTSLLRIITSLSHHYYIIIHMAETGNNELGAEPGTADTEIVPLSGLLLLTVGVHI